MDGYVTIGTELDTKSFDAQIDYVESQLQEIEDKLKQADMGFEVGDTQKLEAQYERLTQKLSTLRQKQADLNKTDLSNIQKSIDNVGNSTSNVIKKVAKWTLTIFGVRSAYNFVRSSISTLSQYNDQIAKDIEYIQFAIASTLQPIIEELINIIYKLLNYVNYIAQAWFGINLFANASAKAMSKGAKSAEKMKKSLAGFDEMNILNENGTTGAIGAMPSMDLSKIQGDVPSWIKWIADNKDLVIGALAGISAGIIALKLGLDLIKSLGIGLILAGIIILIKGIVDFIKDPSWENFLTILEGIALIVAGIAILMGAWIVALVALGVAIVAYVIKNWDKVKEILGVIGEWIWKNVCIPIINYGKLVWGTFLDIIQNSFAFVRAIFTSLVGIIKSPFIVFHDTAKSVIDYVKNAFNSLVSGIKKLFSGDLKGALNDFKNVFSNVFGALWSIAKAPLNLIISGINALISGINKISFDVPDWVPKIGGKKWGFDIPKIPKLAVGGIVNMPGRGVPIGGAIGGENGAEGVIPLTDTQAMETLGATIGKYININLTNITKLDNRQISKEQKKINAQNDFAFNR